MVITMTPVVAAPTTPALTTAAVRQPTLPTTASPFALRGGEGMWNGAALSQIDPTYNSIPAVQRSTVALTADVPVVDTRDHVAAKRATPPRGVPG